MRFLNGRPISQGGRDHTSHRLVLLGLSERRAVLWLYAITLWFGLIGLVGALAQNVLATVAVTVLSASALLVLGLFLAEVQIYSEEEYDRARARLAGKKTVLTRVILHKRRFGEALFDFGAICACLIAAFLLRFEGHLPPQYAYSLSMALPYVVAAQMLAFHLLGMYRTLWRYATTSDILTAARGVLAGTFASFILIRFFSPLHPYPYSTLAIYAAFLLIVITGTRLGLKALRFHFALKWRDGSRRALFVGAGHAGELALHEMINNQALQLVPVGFLDDDPAKHQATIHGVRVLGTRSRLLEFVDRLKVDEVVIAMPSCRNGAVHEISQACREHQIGCREVRSIIMEHVTLNHISSPPSDSIKLS
jgi:UDP-GlcNAc:undecaprenyl-phosphate GlcNAc-1-phosphate transferase